MGPHAKLMCLFLMVIFFHSEGKLKFLLLTHHTLFPVLSISLISKLLEGEFALT